MTKNRTWSALLVICSDDAIMRLCCVSHTEARAAIATSLPFQYLGPDTILTSKHTKLSTRSAVNTLDDSFLGLFAGEDAISPPSPLSPVNILATCAIVDAAWAFLSHDWVSAKSEQVEITSLR